ncbi:hypothetical protein CPB84DRAFT_1761971 [Gymnopilus junonius]|uniref:Arrestin C-terminal-like domain-containing protein n=1 Tax=Gymnopilus junonius TaxID=109634 RepID=A0A9P5NZE7_GYMJU|nr:hypothetical protein CPB84DRAFT_1761971 [Gymnopilus junonius]
MAHQDKSKRTNSLSIRLTESAVFLRTDGVPQRRNAASPDTRSSMLRGLLILDLVKPTKITSIEVEFTATTLINYDVYDWLGIGARRMEVTEEHEVFNASTTYFRGGMSHAARRTASIGPGVSYAQRYNYDLSNNDQRDLEDEWDEVEWEEFRGRLPRMNESVDHTGSGCQQKQQSGSPLVGLRTRSNRRRSDDQHLLPSHIFPISYFTAVLSAPSSTHPAQNLEEFRNSLQSASGIHSFIEVNQGGLSGSIHSLHSVRQQERSLSCHPSTADTTPRLHSPEGAPHTPTRHESSRSRTRSGRPESLSHPHRYPYSPPPLESHASHASAESSSSSSSHLHLSQQHGPGNERGRKGSRFNLSVVSNILMDASKGTNYGAWAAAIDQTPRVMLEEDGSRSRESKERRIVSLVGFGKNKEHHHNDKGKTEGWKEFKKGTYSFPISFSIPANAPPSLQCEFGSVVWRLKASVHRPGAFKPKMTASRDVMVITCPTEEDTEDTENIIVERHWEQQLQYLISISGRSFYIGGTMPVTFTLMPLTKVKIHRLSVSIEEKVDYYTNMRRIARSDPVSRFTLLSIKGEGKGADPILPLDSDVPDVLRNSPFFTIVDPNASDSELTEIASSLMGPGPWTFHQELQLPKSCDILKFTNKNRRSNIIVSHMLKVVIRVERGDDLHTDGRTGKRKLYDIVVQTPVLILSCRCNPEWSSLPRYAEVLDTSTTITPSCPCQVARLRAQEQGTGFRPSSIYMPASLERITSRQSSASSNASAAESSPVNPLAMRSLRNLDENEMILRSNILFERLISGQETVNVASSPSSLPTQTHGNGVAVI